MNEVQTRGKLWKVTKGVIIYIPKEMDLFEDGEHVNVSVKNRRIKHGI